MNELDYHKVRKLADTLAGIGSDTSGFELRQGTMTQVFPAQATLGGDTVAVDVRNLSGYAVAVNDVVLLLKSGGDVIVLGPCIGFGVQPRGSVNNIGFVNSWTALAGWQAPQWVLESDGWVHLRGMATGGLAGLITVIPVGARCQASESFACLGSAGLVTVTVAGVAAGGTAGQVVSSSFGAGVWVSLSGIKFKIY
jgi:hypothetical protein